MGPPVGASDGLLVTTRTGAFVGSTEGLALMGRAVGLKVDVPVGC